MLYFTTRSKANAELKALGMKKNYTCDGRQYWHYGDGSDGLIDHSATITGCGCGKVAVSIFKRKIIA